MNASILMSWTCSFVVIDCWSSEWFELNSRVAVATMSRVVDVDDDQRIIYQCDSVLALCSNSTELVYINTSATL